ncbi:HNH endonuclease [Paractinoplanes toevensis]|nr:HNH endonuclease [Actinoplanes toevensis]
MFDDAAAAEIARMYEAGAAIPDLAALYDCNVQTIRKAIHACGVVLRPREYTSNYTGSEEQRAEIVRLYTNRIKSLRDIAKGIGCDIPLVVQALRDAGVKAGTNNSKVHDYSPEQLAEIAAAHEGGESMSSIARRLKISGKLATKLLRLSGAKLRLRDDYYSEEKKAEIIRRFESGETQKSIAESVKTQQSRISRFLDSVGVERKRALRYKVANGYISVLTFPEDRAFCVPHANGRVLEHRLVMGRYLGRPMRPDETVHHINGDTGDNRIENLQLRTGRHGKGISQVCLDCGSHNVKPVPIAS